MFKVLSQAYADGVCLENFHMAPPGAGYISLER